MINLIFLNNCILLAVSHLEQLGPAKEESLFPIPPIPGVQYVTFSIPCDNGYYYKAVQKMAE